MKHETSVALHEYWRSCFDRGAVSAGQIKAAELIPVLPSLFLLEWRRESGPRFRFCGANLARRYGRDLSGEAFLDLWGVEDRLHLRRHLRVVSMRSAGLVAGVMAETIGAGFTSFEMMLLPLSGDLGAAGAIGSMVRVGGHEEMNRIRARLVAQSLRSVRFLPAPASTSSPFSLLSYLPSVPAPRNPRRRAHLSLVADDKLQNRPPRRPPLTEP